CILAPREERVPPSAALAQSVSAERRVRSVMRMSALLLCIAGCTDDRLAIPGAPDAGGSTGTGGAGAGGAPGGEGGEGGVCRAAGIPPGLPSPGPKTEPKAGVPADACGEGFESDGVGGCDPILPRAPCGPGTFGVPGDTACHEVATCPTASYGDAPLD